MTYIINTDPLYPNAIIFIEQPHQGARRVWGVRDEKDAVRTINATADYQRSSTTDDYAMDTFDGAVEWLAHDLRRLQVVRYADVAADLANWIGGLDAFDKEAAYFEWITELEEDRDE